MLRKILLQFPAVPHPSFIEFEFWSMFFFYIFDVFYVTETFNVNLLYALSTELQSVTQSQVIKLKNIYKPK